MFKRFTAGVAVGYVMGSRAGTKRYDQITDLAERALDVPFVERLADTGRNVAANQGKRALDGFKDRAARWGNSDEPADDDVDGVVDDDYEEPVDEDEDGDDVVDDEDEPRRKSGHRKPARSRPRHRVSSLASAARERGRAD